MQDIFWIIQILSKLTECEYRFCRGYEWLKLFDEYYNYQICAAYGGRFLSVETYYYDDFGKRQTVRYNVLNGYGRCEVPVHRILSQVGV